VHERDGQGSKGALSVDRLDIKIKNKYKQDVSPPLVGDPFTAAVHNGSTVFARWRQCARPFNTKFLGLTANPHSPSQTVARSVRITLRRSIFSLPKFAPAHVKPRLSIRWFLGPTQRTTSNGISVESAVLSKIHGHYPRMDSPTDRMDTNSNQ